MTSFTRYATVIPDLAIDKTLDYGIPSEFIDQVHKGTKVQIPVRGILRTGYVFAVKDKPDYEPVRAITQVLNSQTPLSEDLFALALWIAKYYCAPLGEVLKTILPASVRGKSKEKQQLFVMRNKTREELAEETARLRRSSPLQANVLDVMLNARKGVLLTELMELADTSRAPIDTLVKKGLLSIDIVRVDRSPLVNEDYFRTKPKRLNDEQAAAFEKIASAIAERRFETHLVYGVTGSGKTEIYLQAIEQTMALGRGTIMLVPEISLTPQTIERFRQRFEGSIAVLHHRLSHGERFDEWHRIRRGEAKIAIGARSAVFCPMPDLGLIIVDEEHEASYKQTDSAPCYHGRDVAVMRGHLTRSVVILGSATPSLESTYNAQKGKYVLSELKGRADEASIPTVTIVDMKQEYQKAGGYTNFSASLLDAIKKRHEIGEQVILFLNRRGYHTTLSCTNCGKAVQCPHCETPLTFHKADAALVCHLCAYTVSPPPVHCPTCHSGATMKYKGVGTEQVERSLHAILPDIRTLRVDADTTRHKGSHQKLLRSFGSGKADVLVGTQMIAKGLHFPQVTLVGILNADTSLNIPDFRASETAFQLITQVAGRSGRGAMAGEVVIQTMMPDNRTIELAAKGLYDEFAKEELAVREQFRYPPFTQMAKVLFTGTNAATVEEGANAFRDTLLPLLPSMFEVHPVLPAGHPKINNRYRFQFLVRGPKSTALSEQLERTYQTAKVTGSVRILIDINPLSTYF